MDPFGAFDPSGRPLAGAALFVFALVATGLLEHWQFRLRAQEDTHWWASNGRDVVNALALALLTSALHLFGFPWPLAFGLAGAVVVIENTLQSPLHRHRFAGAASVLISVALGAPLLLAPFQVQRGFSALLLLLFPFAL